MKEYGTIKQIPNHSISQFFQSTYQPQDYKTVAVANNPEMLHQHILSINIEAQHFFKKREYRVSCDKLKQAERILEYVAESCKNIRKELIIVILNNVACLSQLLWDLKSAADYLEAIIYNFSINSLSKSEVKGSQSTIISSLTSEEMIGNFEDDLKLAEYNLKYCAICSSLARHKNGLFAARKSLKTFLFYIKNLETQVKHPKSVDKIKDHVFFSKVNSFKSCIQSKQIFGTQNRRNDFLGLLYHIHKKECAKNQENHPSTYFNTLYLGDIMSLTFQTLDRTNKKQIQSSPLYLFLLTSVSYFSIATEIKIMDHQDESKSDYIYYYFMAIVTYLLLIPFQSPYLNFILSNYRIAGGKSTFIKNQLNATTEQIDDFVKNKQEEGGILPQQSVITQKTNRRKNLRLDQQNLKLKKIIESNDCKSKKQYVQVHFFDKKIKSLSISRKISRNQSKKRQTQGRHLNKVKSNHLQSNYEAQCKEQPKKSSKKDQKSQHFTSTEQCDDLGEKYFQMAFKKPNSPHQLFQKRKQSCISQSQTKDHSGSQKVAKKSKKRDRTQLYGKQSKAKK